MSIRRVVTLDLKKRSQFNLTFFSILCQKAIIFNLLSGAEQNMSKIGKVKLQ